MTEHDLQVLYEEGVLKQESSSEVNEATVTVMDIIAPLDRDAHFSYEDFLAAWEDFLDTLVRNFPDVSAYNLVWLDHGLGASGKYDEVLVIRRFIAELLPDTQESQCFLGHTHRKVGNLEAAIACYKRAYGLAIRWVAENDPDDPASPNRLDACDYLCHLAEAESDLRRFADAFAHITQAYHIMITGDAAFKRRRVYGILHRICLGMHLEDLAEEYRLQALEPVTEPEEEPGEE